MSNIAIYKKDMRHYLYLLAYFSLMIEFFICRMSTYSNFKFISHLSTFLRVSSIIFILIKVYFDKYSIKLLIKVSILSLIIILSFINSGLRHLFYILILVIGAKGIDINWVLRKDIRLRLFLIIFIIGSALFGVIDNYVSIRTNNDSIIRYALGFTHANGFGQAILSYIALKFYLGKMLNKWTSVLFFILIAIGVDIISNSRTSTICILAIIFVHCFYTYKKTYFFTKFLRILALSIPFYSFISIYISVNFNINNPFFNEIDKLVSRRFMHANTIINIYGFSLIGQRTQFISTRQAQLLGIKSIVLDNAYLQLIISMGVIIFILVCLGYTLLTYRVIKANNIKLLSLIIIYGFLGISENGFNYLFFNFTYLFLSYVIYKMPISYSEIKLDRG